MSTRCCWLSLLFLTPLAQFKSINLAVTLALEIKYFTVGVFISQFPVLHAYNRFAGILSHLRCSCTNRVFRITPKYTHAP